MLKPFLKNVKKAFEKASEYNNNYRQMQQNLKDKAREARIEKARRKNGCPVCGSLDYSLLGKKRKGFSVGKMIGGAVLTGGIGAMAGFIGKDGGHTYHCNNCGTDFTKKN